MEWKEYQIQDVCRLINGRAYSNDEMLEHGKYKIVRVGNLSGGNSTWFYSDLELPADKYCHNGDLLFAWACTFGPHIWKEDNTIFHYHIWKIVEDKDVVDRRFFYYYLKFATGGFLGALNGSVMVHITKSSMEKMIIRIPKKLEDQRRIASILSSLDRKIELNNKINADLEEMAQAVFKNWCVDFEPFKNGKFVDSELGMIPEGWKVGCLGDIAEITSGKRPPKKSKDKTKELFIPLIGASDIMGFTSDVLYERPILVIGRVGTHGVVQRFQEKCWPSDNTLVIESRYYNYVYQLLKGIDYSAINRGSTQPLITQTDVKNTDVIIAPENVLKEYESITSTLFSKHRANIKENSRLSTLRDTLLPRLMSGELEVPE